MQSTKARRWVQMALIAGVLAAASLPSTVAVAQSRGHAVAAAKSAISPPRTAASSGGVRLTGSPGVPVVDAGTHTVYVPIQCTTVACGNGKASHDVDLLNTSHCTNSACKVVAVAKVGADPFDAAVDDATHTLYVANAGAAEQPKKGKGTGSVSVLDTRHCRAASHSRCKPLATIHTHGYLVAATIDHKTGTLFLADALGSVLAVDIRACSAVDHAHCHRPVHHVADSLSPSGIAVDSKYSTVYASNIASDKDGNPGDTVSLINVASCNGHEASGCARKSHTVTVGGNPYWDTVDPTTQTVYVANGNDENISIINARTCNATSTSKCPKTAPTATTGQGPEFVALDQHAHTVFAVNTGDNTVSALNTKTCRAGSLNKCPTLPRSKQAAPDQGKNFVGNPSAAAVDTKTGTMYLTEIGGSVNLAVTSFATCNAVKTSSCRHVAASTHTLYAGDEYGNQAIAVIDVSSCTASVTTGCATADKASITVVGKNQYLSFLADNPATHSLYATYGPFDNTPNFLAEIDTTSCNGQVTTGCGQAPVSAALGADAQGLAISITTNTIYAANGGFSSPTLGDTVSVVNGATCDAAVHTGCTPVAEAKVGPGPFSLTVDDSTSSVYVANTANGDAPGTLSVIDSATCNGTDTTGCAMSHPVIDVGRVSSTVAVGPHGTVYVTDYADSAVSVVDTSSCNGKKTTGCGHIAPLRAVGSVPAALAIDAASHSVYVATYGGGGGFSVLPTH
jgi:DNA-binding beta-propeller fold protein YncE